MSAAPGDMWPALPLAILAPACRGWLRLGEVDELEEILPVAEWLAAMNEAQLRAFAVGVLHGLGHLIEDARPAVTARPLIRTPESLARVLLG